MDRRRATPSSPSFPSCAAATTLPTTFIIIINFDPASYESFHVGVPAEGEWKVIFNSDDSEFGGSNFTGQHKLHGAFPTPGTDSTTQITVALPGLAGLVLKRQGPELLRGTEAEAPPREARSRSHPGSVPPGRSARRRRRHLPKKAPAGAKKPAPKKSSASKTEQQAVEG